MPPLAAFDAAQAIGGAIASALTTIVMTALFRRAQRESLTAADTSVAEYPNVLKLMGLGSCGGVTCGAVAAALFVRGPDVWKALLLAAFFGSLALVTHLEAQLVLIDWDDKFLYTRSPWRRARTIPWSSVERCDYSESMQWYRIRTRRHGIVRVSIYLKGVPNLLSALPVNHPKYPPRTAMFFTAPESKHRDERDWRPKR